jgi:hypothetical protein
MMGNKETQRKVKYQKSLMKRGRCRKCGKKRGRSKSEQYCVPCLETNRWYQRMYRERKTGKKYKGYKTGKRYSEDNGIRPSFGAPGSNNHKKKERVA